MMNKIRIEVDGDLRFEGALSPSHDIYLPEPGKGDPGLFVDAAFGVVLEGRDIDRVKEGHDVVVAITGDVRYEMFLVAGEGSPRTGASLLFGETVFDVKRDTVRKVIETITAPDMSTV